MVWFTVETTYVADRDKLAAARPRHREYLRRLADEGRVTAAGPWSDDSAGFAIYRVEDRTELDTLLDEDPYSTEAVAAARTVHEWKLVLGKWAQ
ncbi:MAG: hypothetical protein GEV28_05930 [Actinophytocola sp.]|uniref:YciI family protein n=1 Tax=Actinophytocola sp. TaxID=1872138 RepID=UPI00132BFFD8|nr:muconolactone Delta-isomerase family protein [Actinophytocola sp.]MPZ79952.1 hypothetical protein [Actinophytocola sp.]